MIKIELPRALLEPYYSRAAEEYLDRLPLEHFMESTPHATQRKITVESLDLLAAHRSDVHVFNELLVQYPLPRRRRPGQVVPDNMVVIHPGPVEPVGSYDLPLQPAPPFWMLEYVSKGNKRKDYVDNKRRYEHELKVPHYLLFDPQKQKLMLYHHNGKRYVAVKPNANGRLPLPELDLEMAILDRWVRYWYKGKLLPLPAEMQKELGQAEKKLDQAEKELAEMRNATESATRRAEAAEREVLELRKRLEKMEPKKNGSK